MFGICAMMHFKYDNKEIFFIVVEGNEWRFKRYSMDHRPTFLHLEKKIHHIQKNIFDFKLIFFYWPDSLFILRMKLSIVLLD